MRRNSSRIAKGKRRYEDKRTGRALVEALESRELLSGYFISPSGSDSAAGTLIAPWKTVQAALNKVADGDTLTLRGGTYGGGLNITRKNLTIQSYAGETARIAAPTSDAGITSAITFQPDAWNNTLRNLDISGGYYYAIKSETYWDWGIDKKYGSSYNTIENSKIHDSGRDVFKIAPGSDHWTVRNSEIYNSGRRDASNAEGIDVVGGDWFTLQDSNIHDVVGSGIYAKGGSRYTLIERNKFQNINLHGIMLGEDTDWEFFDTNENPSRYENLDGVVRNNIVINSGGSGVVAQAALRPQIYNNTLIDVGNVYQAGVQFLGVDHYGPPNYNTPEGAVSRDITFMNNVVTVDSGRPAVKIRTFGGGITGTLNMANNRYQSMTGAAQFADDRSGFSGNLAAWKSAVGTDANSTEGSPGVDGTGHLFSTSPIINQGRTLSGFSDDIDREARGTGGAWDIGADEYGGTPTPTPTPDPTPTPTPDPTPTPVTNVPDWENHAVTDQSGDFVVEFDAKPTQLGSDVVIGLSNGAAAAHTDLATIVRFNASNQIDARNGGSYTANAAVSYTAGTNYHFKMVVHTAQKRYDVYVTPAGGSAVQLASNYAFRSEQAAVASLNNWGKYDEVGDAPVSNFMLSTVVDPTPPPLAAGDGLKGEYFDNMDFTSPKFTRTDANINFNWGSGSPASGMGADTFSVRWTGKIMPKDSGTYTFYTTSDDGVRLWINGQLVINNWTVHAPTENKGAITLQAGQKYDIKMEYFERSGGAVAKLMWSSATQAKEVVPTSQLFTA
jgi:hypothetical protein